MNKFYYLITCDNGIQFGVIAGDEHDAYYTACEVLARNTDIAKGIKDIKEIMFFHKNFNKTVDELELF